VYELETHRETDVPLEDPSLVGPSEILSGLEAEGVERIYWLRLEPLAGAPAYVVKPGPFDLERVYDARTGSRIDPLPEARLRAIADAHLTGTRVTEVHESDEFNRYYSAGRVPALAMRMDGAQPSELVFSSASGRILRRTDPLAEWFHRAYLSVHVWQWGDALPVFTALLFGLVGIALVLVSLGGRLWWTRRDVRRRWTASVRPARRIHGRLAPVAGFLLATQMLVGAYLWYNLGLIEPRFRGQGSFEAAWSGGLATSEALPLPVEIGSAAVAFSPDTPRMQRYEWRAAGERRYGLAYPEPNREGVLVDASTWKVLDRLAPNVAAAAAEAVVVGTAVGPPVESTEYWMDYNARIPTYRFRFSDPDDSDVHVSQVTGEVIQRRPAIWRAFGPFLAYHTFGFTGNPWIDTLLLSTLQLVVLTMVLTGWRMALRTRRVGESQAARGTGQSSNGMRLQ
jgi:hypothetical protein